MEDGKIRQQENVTSSGESVEKEKERGVKVLFLPNVVSGKQGKYFLSGSEMPTGELSRGTTCSIQSCAEICGSKRTANQTNKAEMLNKANMTCILSQNECDDIKLISEVFLVLF